MFPCAAVQLSNVSPLVLPGNTCANIHISGHVLSACTTWMSKKSVADPGGTLGAPPKGTNSFICGITILRNMGVLGISAAPTRLASPAGNPGSATNLNFYSYHLEARLGLGMESHHVFASACRILSSMKDVQINLGPSFIKGSTKLLRGNELRIHVNHVSL